jgi:hypothetical protein
MIFQHTWQAVIEGKKQQTRRLVKPGEWLSKYMTDDFPHWRPAVLTKTDRMKWAVGCTYAVQPGRGQPAIIYNPDHPCYGIDIIEPGDHHYETAKDGRWNYKGQGYQQARIRITGLSCEDVRKISHEDAEAEGFESRKLFLDVWLSMHDKPIYEAYRSGALIPRSHATLLERPDERYQAWVIEFESVR